MKRSIVKLCLALAAVVASPLLARADLIYYEGFNYPNGNITNVSGGVWVNFSGNGSNDMIINNHVLEVAATSSFTNTYILGKGRADDDRRPFATVVDSPYTNTVQVVYASFTVICTNLPNGLGSYFASFYNPKSGSGGGYFGRVMAFTNGAIQPNTWRIGVAGNTLSTNANDGGYPMDLALNTPYQVVEELDPVTLDAATIWVNPININQTAFSASETHYTSGDSIGACTTFPVTDYSFRQASSFNAFFQITNLAVATTFAEAATNVWSTNALAPIILYQPVGTTNFVGAPVVMTALANGQGLGNLTYQWLQNGNPYPSGNGTNKLTIPSAQISDTGDYKLVVTTPYGLSVTSAVTHVSISAAPVPPTFTSQPGSRTVYRGQTVALSATVISPGNVTFTWYSNNVVVTDGVISGGDGSTLTLNNVQTSFSAAYKVAATNDVAVNGVVSTNSVLTVVNPPAVSVAYLRSLIDPATFATTASPTQPYQVTGIITSYTNTTTSDTSSYYLQDATAGINIFATFGSTFRPQLGDVVTFTGVLSTYTGASTGGLELYADTVDFPYTSYSIVSNNFPLPTARIVPFTVTNDFGYLYLNTNLLASRVTLNNVYFGTNAGNVLSTTANTTVTVTNQNGTPFALQFYYLDQDTAGQTLPAYASSVTGNLIGLHPNVFLVVSKWSDINTSVPVVPIPLSAGYAGGTLTFNWTDASFNLQWATNVVGPYTTIPGAAPGFTTNTVDQPQLYFRLSHP